MAPSVNTTTNYLTQESINNIYQEANTTCLASCNADISDVNIIVKDYSRVGNVSIDQMCQSDALCNVKTNLDSIATQQLEAAQLGQAQSVGQSWLTWPGFSVNTVNNISNQYLENTISQSINTVCQSIANTELRNFNVLVSNNSEVAGIQIAQSAQANADCTVENTARASVDQTTSAEQTAKAIGGSAIVLIIMMIVIAIIVLGMLYLKNQNDAIKIKSQSELYGKTIEKLTSDQLYNILQKKLKLNDSS